MKGFIGLLSFLTPGVLRSSFNFLLLNFIGGLSKDFFVYADEESLVLANFGLILVR
jgi:hypothetical protein